MQFNRIRFLFHEIEINFPGLIIQNKNLFDDFADIGIQGIDDAIFKKLGFDSYINRESGHNTYKIFDSKARKKPWFKT